MIKAGTTTPEQEAEVAKLAARYEGLSVKDAAAVGKSDMPSERGLSCCSAYELTGFYFHNPFGRMKNFCERHKPGTTGRKTMMVFSAISHYEKSVGYGNPTEGPRQYGQEFCDFINEHGLGRCTAGTPVLSGHSGNTITMFTWALDWDAIDAWYKEHFESKGETKAPEWKRTPDKDVAAGNAYLQVQAAGNCVIEPGAYAPPIIKRPKRDALGRFLHRRNAA